MSSIAIDPPAHLVYPGGALRWVAEYYCGIYCTPTCLWNECRVMRDHPDVNAVFVDEIPAEGITCCVCGETHGAGLNQEGQP